MSATVKVSTVKSPLREVRIAIYAKRQEANRLREEVEDLVDYLDALVARAESKGKKRLTLSQARARLELCTR